MKRPDCIRHWREVEGPDDSTYPGSDEIFSIGAPLARRLGLGRLGIHHERLPPGRRTSYPHAESDEEEFIYVLEGYRKPGSMVTYGSWNPATALVSRQEPVCVTPLSITPVKRYVCWSSVRRTKNTIAFIIRLIRFMPPRARIAGLTILHSFLVHTTENPGGNDDPRGRRALSTMMWLTIATVYAIVAPLF